MTRRVYQTLFLISILVFTFLFARDFRGVGVSSLPHMDKLVHFTIFFVLAAVMVRAFKLPVFVHLVLLAFYGIAIELMQSTIPYRSASVADVVADFSGAASFFLLFGIYSRFKKNQNG
ncbi:VanZ family protein [Pseudoalteromonas ostreae]|uniref:VanZ family protein n=1 Tax=Pseudoalteromonas ostreae TaxID=2774154 RepID=UPI001B398666|nr:VanZ family protein [Pseudoalteromonas ostreae]